MADQGTHRRPRSRSASFIFSDEILPLHCFGYLYCALYSLPPVVLLSPCKQPCNLTLEVRFRCSFSIKCSYSDAAGLAWPAGRGFRQLPEIFVPCPRPCCHYLSCIFLIYSLYYDIGIVVANAKRKWNSMAGVVPNVSLLLLYLYGTPLNPKGLLSNLS